MLSDVVADRVVALRKAAGMTREDLAERCQQLGGEGLTVDTLANIETGRRAKASQRRRRKVDIDELVYMAQALDVPLVWLLADVETGAPVPVTDDTELDPWTALMWFTGQESPGKTPGPAWVRSATALTLIRRLRAVLANYEWNRNARYTDDEAGRNDAALAQRHSLQAIKGVLEEFRRGNVNAPPLPDHVLADMGELLAEEAAEAKHFMRVVQERQAMRQLEPEQLPDYNDHQAQQRFDDAADADTSALRHLAAILERLYWWGPEYCPPVPDSVAQRADELGVTLGIISAHELRRKARIAESLDQ